MTSSGQSGSPDPIQDPPNRIQRVLAQTVMNHKRDWPLNCHKQSECYLLLLLDCHLCAARDVVITAV